MTDLGLDWLTSIDLFGLILCFALFFLADRMRSFPFCAVAAVGTIAIGLRILLASEDILPFIILFTISAAEVLYGAKFKGW